MSSIDVEIVRTLVERSDVRRVFDVIASKGEIRPVLRLDLGVMYPDLANIPGWNTGLEELVKMGLIEREVYMRVLRCPNCRSTHVMTVYKCVFCGSPNVTRTEIIQHTICGYTGPKLQFQFNGRLKCPNCGLYLREEGVDYIVLGRVFECLDCGRRMDRPEIEHECLECTTTFTYKNAIYEPVYMYRLSELGKFVVERGIIFRAPIVYTLKELGYHVEEDAELKGLSGISHKFDIIARKDGELIAIDILAKTEGIIPEMLSMMSKIMDIVVDRYILVMREAPEEARTLAERHNIMLIEVSSASDASAMIRRILTGEEEEVSKVTPVPPLFFS